MIITTITITTTIIVISITITIITPLSPLRSEHGKPDKTLGTTDDLTCPCKEVQL